MFERFTDRARETVVLAQDEARTLRHAYLGTEHLLLGMLREGTGVGAKVLTALGISWDAVRADVLREVGEGPGPALVDSDAEALRAIGIDLEEVRRRVEEAFGPGALERRARTGRRRWRSRHCEGVPPHIPFTPRAKKVLELAVREARQLGHGYLGTEHILLGLVREGEGPAVEILRLHGLTDGRVRAAVMEKLGRGGDLPGRSA